MPTEWTRMLETTLDTFVADCHKNAVDHGFYEADGATERVLLNAGRPDLAEDFRVAKALSRHALINSEVGEATEGVRKPCLDSHLPEFTSEEVEMADVLIRIGDYSGHRKLRLGAAVVAKMAFNKSRPPMHGKKA